MSRGTWCRPHFLWFSVLSICPPLGEHSWRLGWYHGRREEGRVQILFAESPHPPFGAGERVCLEFPLADPHEKGARLHLEVSRGF
jgi:hypothetical protein